ncbi:MAG: hypothetical protein GC192_20080 [Bacteroidetes bacterium]|nr:hypothetical protein [Bacteroidota bacterium]
MKNSKKFRFLSMIFAICMIVFFCNELSAQNHKTPTNTTFAKKAMIKIAPDFDFQIIANTCFAEGVSLNIKIDKPQDYAYIWEVNGSHGGHQMNQDCICGDYAKVRVMRLKDGKQVTRTIKLPSCGDQNQ